MDSNVFGTIQEAIADALKIEKNDISIDKKVADFSNWDSLGFVTVIMNLSEKFSREMDIVKLVNCKAISEIYEYIITSYPT
jgi:acyl carrier protein